MSDIPSGALDAAEDSRAVSLLARVILPRPGEPLDVRKLYIEESDTNARRAHAPDRTTLEIGAESEVSFATWWSLTPSTNVSLAPGVRPMSCHARSIFCSACLIRSSLTE